LFEKILPIGNRFASNSIAVYSTAANMDITKAEAAEPQSEKRETRDANLVGEGTADHLHIDPELEKRVVRKIDRTLIPLVMALCQSLFILFFLSFM
jgi:hypothetical protein